MATRIDDLKNGKMEKVHVIEVKIVKKVTEDYYIVADETAHILLASNQNLKEGSAYKIIKPSYDDSKLRKSSKFAAVKVERNIRTKVLKTEDEKILIASIHNDGEKPSQK